jgi:predicted DNA-binding transcriptional regulator AlpA
MESPFWPTKKVQAYFDISRATLTRWRDDKGFPPAVHFGGHPRGPCRFVIADVLEWARKRREQSTERLPDPSVAEGLQQDAAE